MTAAGTFLCTCLLEQSTFQSESESDAEQEFKESTVKKRKYSGFHKFTVIREWSTAKDSILELLQIDHGIYTLMKTFMQQSRLMTAPGHRELDTDTLLSGSSIAQNFTTRGGKLGSDVSSAR